MISGNVASDKRGRPWLGIGSTAWLAVAIVAMTTSHTLATPHIRPVIDDVADCPMPGALPPEAYSVTAVTDEGQDVTLDVVVGLDGISRRRGREIFRKAAEAYAPLSLTLKARFIMVPLDSQSTSPSGAPGIEARSAIAALRSRLGGGVPKGADLAYLATAKDVYLLENGDANFGYGGYAECIGGVRDASTAIAVGEGAFAMEDDSIAGVVRLFMNASGKIAAHELGHLLGARHEESNCVEGIPSEMVPERDIASPCTLMWPSTGFSIDFGALEAAVVRGYSLRFARP